MEENIDNIRAKILSFKRRYYLSFFIRGVLLTASFVIFYFLIISLLEYNLWMSKTLRLTVLLSLIGVFLACIFIFLKKPLAWWLYRKGLGQEESAKMIGSFFPTISDQLLNLIQLSRHPHPSRLLEASILQKAKGVEQFSFEQAIDLRKNKRYLWLLLIPMSMVFVLLMTAPSLLTQSAKRIVQFDQEFTPTAPFSFQIRNQQMRAFPHEDFTVILHLEGRSFPDAVYLQSHEQILKMEALSATDYRYTFKKINREIPFHFEADGVRSQTYHIGLVYRPELTQLKILFDFPTYLSRPKETLLNTGSFKVPEGTQVVWQVGTKNSAAAKMGFSSSGFERFMMATDTSSFTHSRIIRNPEAYWISLSNQNARNKDSISYFIDVIKDQYPQITVRPFVDSVFFKTILLGGYINDDYGLTALTFNYQKTVDGIPGKTISLPIPIKKPSSQQDFFYQWQLDSLHLSSGETVAYFLEVWDNDGINGHKPTRSPMYTFVQPEATEIRKNMASTQEQTKVDLDQGMKATKELGDVINEARKKLQEKKEAGWQEKQLLEDILRKKDSLYKSIDELKNHNQLLEEKKKSFLKQDERIVKKAQQIQKLMDEMLDDKTKALFKELQELLQKNADLSQIKDVLDKIDRKENNLENAFKRMMELLNQFRFEFALDQAIQNLKKGMEQQKELLDDTQQGNKKEDKEDDAEQGDDAGLNKKLSPAKQNQTLAKKQHTLANQSEQLKKELDTLAKMSEKADQEEDFPDAKALDEIQDDQQQSEESLEKQNRKKSIESQKKAIDKMQRMQKQLEQLQSAMEMEMNTENLESLRHILHGLIKLSYDQEALMDAFHNMRSTDPKYVGLSQQQLKVQNDFNVLKDSLLSLSERDPFISSVATREIDELSYHLDQIVLDIRERKQGNGEGEMQWAMTGINNLALMLDDYFDMMKGGQSGMGGGKKKRKSPSLSDMQKQLNQQISKLKKSGKTGRQLSEGLAKMAAEQERIRRAFQRMQENLEKKGGKDGKGGKFPGQGLAKKMEDTEMELLNKKITEETIKRQKQILSRLLDSEKSMREKGFEKKRKGETAKEYQKALPKVFEEYLRLQKKEIELLKTVPPKLHPYYKKEVNQYFERIKDK